MWPMPAIVSQHTLQSGLGQGEGTGNGLVCPSIKMAYFCNDDWKEDIAVKNDLKKYVGQLFKREEILSFVQNDYPHSLT